MPGSFTNATLRASVPDFHYAHIIEMDILDAAYSKTFMRGLVRNASLVGQPSNAKRFPRWPALTAAAVAENADIGNTEVVSTGVTITVGEIGIRMSLSDALQEDDIVSGTAPYGAQGGKALADKWDSDIAALLAGFSNTVGTAAAPVDLTEANFLLAIETLENADAPGPYVFVTSPSGVHQLRADIVTNGGNVYSSSPAQEGRWTIRYGGYAFSSYGIDIYQTTNVPLIDATADHYRGGMFSQGVALAHVAKREARVEFQRDASKRLTEIVLTARYGVGELIDEYGVTVFTTPSS